jgi:type I restriction enzyme S subunit
MDRSRLLQHFDTLVETPDAVAKLRDLVLNLAVRGNLVPQSEEDEPGTELLKQILEKKRRLTHEGVIKKTLVLESITPDACPFEAPKN